MAVKLTRLDLDYILVQIKMAEAGQEPVNGLLSFGLREIAGTNNNLVQGQGTFGSTDQPFPTVTTPVLQNAQVGTSYLSTSGLVVDAQPRMISNLISDQTANNPAAVAAQTHQLSFLGAGYQNTTAHGADGLFGITTAYTVTGAGVDGVYGTADDAITESGLLPGGKTAFSMSGTAGSLLHTISKGADGVAGATTEYKLISNGVDNIAGTADDIIDEFGANHTQDGNVAGSDDIIGTRGDLLHTLSVGGDGVLGTADDVVTDDVVSDDIVSGNLSTPTDASASSQAIPGLAQSLFINNVTPDNGLSAPANSWFTFFGQFFDHGLDMIDKGGNGTVFIPLGKDDPLYVPGAPTNFMVLTRATDLPGPDGILGTADDVHKGTNQTSPFVDQSQTYASDPSHQVFLREYMIGQDGNLHSSGALLGHPKVDGKDGMATWADLKANAANFLGIRITDADVGNVPLLATDAYGNFLAGPHGMPQIVVRQLDGTTALIEGTTANPVALDTAAYKVLRTGHAFINDMAQAASPTGIDQQGNSFNLAPDTDSALGQFNADGTPANPNATYDNELLDAHYVAGDGRVNENIGLTAVQDIFHSEHDRLISEIQATIQDELSKGNVSFAANWVLPTVDLTISNATAKDNPNVPDGTAIHVIQPNEWNGERLFQAAKFGTETEYQHLVFEEFARYVAPSIHVFGGINVHIDPAITSEFANVVYRFGHSMLDENVNLYQLDPTTGKAVIDPATGQPILTQEGLIQAFTNPAKFASDPNMTADIVLGTVNQVSNSIDEFVTGSLRNNLLGLPLDLAALNIARGRDTGVAPLNLVRNQLYAQTGEAQLKAYTSWSDFGSQLKHSESLINFVAAYGTHHTITDQVVDSGTGLLRDPTAAERRAAATILVHKGTVGDSAFNPADPASIDAYNFMHSQGLYGNNTTDKRAIHDASGNAAAWSTGSVTGLDAVDMWVGGLAEKLSLFGGQLGSTFEYIFRTQMEALQDGDRLYYLPRIEGMDYEESLQDSSLAQLIRANTDIKHLPGNIFLTPEYTVEASDYFVKATNPDGSVAKDAAGNSIFALDASGNKIATDPSTWLKSAITETDGSHKPLVNVLPDGTVQFLGDDNFLGNTIVLGGTEGNDRLVAGAADDDTVWGDGGNDYIDGGGGNDFLFGGDGNDTLVGGQGNDTLHGDAGDDTIFGGDGVDNIFGGDGNDYIEGGRGDDIIMGGLGNDIIIGNEGADQLTGNEGDDWLESRGGQGDLMFGDSGAPTGGQPLYSGNDVMIGGVAGGDVMKGFSGDDIMVGNGGFTKFIGGLGFDWGSYENATHGVSEDMNRKEFISPNGSVDTIRDVWQHTEGASGSQFDDIILGTNDTRLLLTKDTLDNVNLITGLQDFFPSGPVSFGAGNIMLGGGGNDSLKGNGGNDIIEGDAWLHVALTSYSAGGQIIRQINYDPNGNTYDAASAHWDTDLNTGLMVAGTFVPGKGFDTPHPANVDTAVYNDIAADYDIALFGPDPEGFLTIDHARAGAAIVGGNPQGLLGGNDGTDRIRHIERLEFTDGTIAIASDGTQISSSFSMPTDPDYAIKYAPYYDAVPVGTPTIAESGGLDPATRVDIGQTLTASAALVADYDGITTPITYQWQENDVLRGEWVDVVGATASTFKPTAFLEGALGIRVKASYVDGQGYKETVTSASTAAVTLPGNVNTAPTFVTAQQFNGIANTTAVYNAPFDFFTPLSSIFTDGQTASTALTYTATMADGSSLASAGLQFQTILDATGTILNGEFSTLPAGPGPDGTLGTADDTGTLATPGQLAIRVTVMDNGPGVPLSLTDTFKINVMPTDNPPVAGNDFYTILENATLTADDQLSSVLANDFDPDPGDTIHARLVTGPTHGTLALAANGTFVYTPNANYVGVDSFVYQDTDVFSAVSNKATATISVTPIPFLLTAALVQDSGIPTDRITNNGALIGTTFPNAAVFAVVNNQPMVQFATADAAGNWSGTPPMSDGTEKLVITATDPNPGAAPARTDTVTLNFTLDTTAPLLTAGLVNDTGVVGDRVTSSALLGGTTDPGGTVSIGVVGGGLSTVTANDAGVWRYAPPLSDGNYTVVVTGSTDVAGNTAQQTLTFTLDTSNPTGNAHLAHDTGSSSSDGVTSDATIVGSGDPGATVFATIDNGAETAVTTALQDGTWSVQPVLSDGPHTIVVRETDLAGNDGISSVALVLDTAKPAVTAALVNDTGSSATDQITSNPTLSGTADPGSFVQVLVDNQGPPSSIPVNAAGKWGFGPFLEDGPHTVEVTETDLAGNVGSASVNFTVDRLAPGAPTIGNFSYVLNAGASALASFTVSGTAEAGSKVVLSNGAVLGTVTAAADGTWSLTVTPTPTAAFTSTLSLTATDLAGNVSPAQTMGLIVGNGAANTLTAAGANASVPNVILGLGSSDTINGGSGNDRLDGGVGADKMTGGGGDDTYVVDNAGDLVIEAPGGGTDTVLASVGSYTLPGDVENLTHIGATNFIGTGNTLANVITGGAGNDTLNDGTGPGVDTLIGGAGNDTYIVAVAADVIVEAAGGGTDTVRTILSSYTLGANLENLTFIGGGSFAGTGNALANVITGGAADDKLDGGLNTAGVDRMIGGSGNDTYVVNNAGDVVVEALGGGTDTVQTALGSYTLAANVENLVYTGRGNFTGTGNALANSITGGGGNDTLADGGGADTLTGGGGNDTYVVTNAGDTIVEADGGGTDTVRTNLSNYTLGANLENLTYVGGGAFTGTGNALSNVITGGAGADTLSDGGAGADTMIGGAGGDTYLVNVAGDVITEAVGGGTDTVRTGLSSYTLGANVENLVYTGGGDFAGTGNALTNSLTGAAGNDTLDGGKNTAGVPADRMSGGAGNDTYVVNNAGDLVLEAAGAGTDTVNVLINSYTMAANVEILNFIGSGNFNGAGNQLDNTMTGGAGNDTLNGGAGNDTLVGGAGADVLTGGAGNDTFLLAKGDANNDLISDFSRAANNTDQIVLSGYGLGATLVKVSGGQGLAQTAYAVQVGGVTQDQFRLAGNITLSAPDYKFA